MKKVKSKVFQTVAEVERSMFPALQELPAKRHPEAPAIGTGLACDFGHRAGKRPRQPHKSGK